MKLISIFVHDLTMVVPLTETNFLFRMLCIQLHSQLFFFPLFVVVFRKHLSRTCQYRGGVCHFIFCRLFLCVFTYVPTTCPFWQSDPTTGRTDAKNANTGIFGRFIFPGPKNPHNLLNDAPLCQGHVNIRPPPEHHFFFQFFVFFDSIRNKQFT